MMRKVGARIESLAQRAEGKVRLPRMVIASLVTGLLVGVVIAGFEKLTVSLLLHELFERPLWQQAMAPAIGLTLSYAILRFSGPNVTNSTSDEYVRVFHDRNPHIPLRELPAKLLAGSATIGFCGAVGLEGPAIYGGSSIGQNVQDKFGHLFRREEARVLLTAGAAAGVAAIFQAPATGVIFALEAPYRDDVSQRALLPALVASASSYFVYVLLIGTESVLPFFGSVQQELRLTDILGGAVVGLAAGFGARGVAWALRHAKDLAVTTPAPYRLIGGGAILAGLVLLSQAVFEDPVTLGPGIFALEWLTDGVHTLGLIAALFAFRIVATLSTVSAGGTGGLFIPLAVQGVIVGNFVGRAIGAGSVSLYSTLGLSAFLAAGYRTPIAAVMFVAESNGAGASHVVPALIAAAASQLAGGTASVTAHQQEHREGHLESRFSLPLTAALTTDVLTVPSDATASEFVHVHAIGMREREVAIVDSGFYVGMCRLESLRPLPRESWDDLVISEIMDTTAPVARPSWTLRDVLKALDQADIDQIAVTDNDNHFIGVVKRSEILKLDEILEATDGE